MYCIYIPYLLGSEELYTRHVENMFSALNARCEYCNNNFRVEVSALRNVDVKADMNDAKMWKLQILSLENIFLEFFFTSIALTIIHDWWHFFAHFHLFFRIIFNIFFFFQLHTENYLLINNNCKLVRRLFAYVLKMWMKIRQFVDCWNSESFFLAKKENHFLPQTGRPKEKRAKERLQRWTAQTWMKQERLRVIGLFCAL